MRKLLALATLTSFASLAHASYYVVDNPPPAPVSALIRSMPAVSTTASDTQQVTVPFARHSVSFSRDALRALSNMLDNAQSAIRIAITACGDAGDGGDSIAYRRAANVKAWLLDNGIDGNVVTTSADGTVMKSPKGYSCVVSLSMPASPRGAGAYAPVVQANRATVADQPAPQPASAQVARQAERNEQMKMISRVLDMASAKIITPENAVAMIAQLMKDSDPAAAVAKPQPVAAIAPAPVIAQITALPTQSFALAANRTLKETLSEWARSAGWREPTWGASNPYLVAQGQNLSGDFMGALRTVSDLVPGLDFRVNTATREITVMDAVH